MGLNLITPNLIRVSFFLVAFSLLFSFAGKRKIYPFCLKNKSSSLNIKVLNFYRKENYMITIPIYNIEATIIDILIVVLNGFNVSEYRSILHSVIHSI